MEQLFPFWYNTMVRAFVEMRASTGFARLARHWIILYRFFIGYWILKAARMSIRAFHLWLVIEIKKPTGGADGQRFLKACC
jgi:hypothetical protein